MKKNFLTLITLVAVLSFSVLNAQIKSIKTISKSDIDGKSHISEFKKFDKNDHLIELKDYDSEGKLESLETFKYNEDKLILKTNVSLDSDDKEVTKTSYNSKLNTKTNEVFRNDKLIYTTEETFDDNKNIIKVIQNVAGESLTVKYKYMFNKNNKIIKVIAETNGNEELFKTYTYDDLGREIEVIKFGPHLNYKTTTTYLNNRILRILKTRITKGLTEYVESDISYDHYFNPISQKVYNEKKLINEHKMTYSFNKKGDWITKTVVTKDYIWDAGKEFKPNYTETRKIKYW